MFPVTINHIRTFDFSAVAVDGGNVVLVHGFAITQVANAETLQDDFPSLLFGQSVRGSKLFQLMAEMNEYQNVFK